VRISYDKLADALYFRFGERVGQCRVVRLTLDVAVDTAADEIVVGLEILGASRHFERAAEPEIELEGLVGKPATG
jgi:uncharacterized protein YuzE